MLTATDYYPFGMEMPGRKYNPQNYRYGFNGKENDRSGEWGLGLVQDYGFRLYNPGLGRFLSVDPLREEFPWNSTYAFAENRPIDGIDLEGGEYLNKTSGFPAENKLGYNATDNLVPFSIHFHSRPVVFAGKGEGLGADASNAKGRAIVHLYNDLFESIRMINSSIELGSRTFWFVGNHGYLGGLEFGKSTYLKQDLPSDIAQNVVKNSWEGVSIVLFQCLAAINTTSGEHYLSRISKHTGATIYACVTHTSGDGGGFSNKAPLSLIPTTKEGEVPDSRAATFYVKERLSGVAENPRNTLLARSYVDGLGLVYKYTPDGKVTKINPIYMSKSGQITHSTIDHRKVVNLETLYKIVSAYEQKTKVD